MTLLIVLAFTVTVAAVGFRRGRRVGYRAGYRDRARLEWQHRRQ